MTTDMFYWSYGISLSHMTRDMFYLSYGIWLSHMTTDMLYLSYGIWLSHMTTDMLYLSYGIWLSHMTTDMFYWSYWISLSHMTTDMFYLSYGISLSHMTRDMFDLSYGIWLSHMTTDMFYLSSSQTPLYLFITYNPIWIQFWSYLMNVIPETRRVHSIWYLRFYYFPLLIYRGMVDLTKQHYVSHGRDPMSWIFDDMINTGDLLFRPTESCVGPQQPLACRSRQTKWGNTLTVCCDPW